MSIMKAIYQMREEADIMRTGGVMTDTEIDEFVSEFCEARGFEKPAVLHVAGFGDGTQLAEEEVTGELPAISR